MDTNGSALHHSRPLNRRSLVHSIQDLQALQREILLNTDDHAMGHPQPNLFPSSPSCFMREPSIDREHKHCVILLHDKDQNGESLKDLSHRLQDRLPESVFLLVRGLTKSLSSDNSYQWAHSNNQVDDDFLRSCIYVLKDIIFELLIEKCRFRPRNIVILGHGQGSLVGMRAATIWNEIEFGGVIALGTSLRIDSNLIGSVKARTPILMMQARGSPLETDYIELLKRGFHFVDLENRLESDADIPTGSPGSTTSSNPLKPYMDFLVHRLQRDEWKKQNIISFDGGGIRGYGSLLILKNLMEKIEKEERMLDPTVKSSFHPSPFKPTSNAMESKSKGDHHGHNGSQSQTDLSKNLAELFEDHPSTTARFLPCHYFTYGAGTSTGGLISIMLQRFRMTVDECLQEYKNLGAEVFGHPRLPLINRIRPKFDEKILERVIIDVCERRGECLEWGDLYYNLKHHTVDDDMCRCHISMVLAYSDQKTADSPYIFRTYRTPEAQSGPNPVATATQSNRGYGDPSQLEIWKVARATSAAPKYFAPIEIKSGDGKKHLFVDGGFGCNNPAREIYNDVVHKDGKDALGTIVSIGTGEKELRHMRQRNHVRDTLSNLWLATKLPARTSRVHEDLETFSKSDGFDYFRFYGGRELGEVALDEWKSHKVRAMIGRRSSESGQKTLKKIKDAVDNYLRDPQVQKSLERAAEVLVKKRRLRMRDVSEWDRYASFSYYSCESQWPHCNYPRMRTVDDFREHIKRAHRVDLEPEGIKNKIRKSRQNYWVYRPQPVLAS